MISVFSSRLKGTFCTPPVCHIGQSKGNFQVALYHAYYLDAIIRSQGDRKGRPYPDERTSCFVQGTAGLASALVESLLYFDFCADLGHLLGDALGLFFGDGFLNGFGSLVNDGFSLFQAQTGEFAHDFDDVDFVGANLGEDGVKLGLLLHNGGGSNLGGDSDSRAGGGDGSGADAPLVLQGLGQLDQFQYVQFLNFSDNGVYGHVLFSP